MDKINVIKVGGAVVEDATSLKRIECLSESKHQGSLAIACLAYCEDAELVVVGCHCISESLDVWHRSSDV